MLFAFGPGSVQSVADFLTREEEKCKIRWEAIRRNSQYETDYRQFASHFLDWRSGLLEMNFEEWLKSFSERGEEERQKFVDYGYWIEAFRIDWGLAFPLPPELDL